MEFSIGQRWISHTEADLGLGIVVEQAGRRAARLGDGGHMKCTNAPVLYQVRMETAFGEASFETLPLGEIPHRPNIRGKSVRILHNKLPVSMIHQKTHGWAVEHDGPHLV